MIDEWYDRAHREGRADLNAGLARLFDAIALRVLNTHFRQSRRNAMRALFLASLAAAALALTGAAAPPSPEPLSLAGTWVMESAYEIRGDGTRTTNYGEHPKGLMVVDAAGRYSIQIYRPDRANFASGVKAQGLPEEYRLAVLGSSTHFGRVTVDAAAKQLLFDVEASSFPNWEGIRQVRNYGYAEGTLTYAVPASASGNGTVAYSVWRRAR